jgi:hypothetical protein
MNVVLTNRYQRVVDEIGGLKWAAMTRAEMTAVAWAYYYFSVQFCETVEMACRRHPGDPKLLELRAGECDTDNLSPYPGVAAPGERMNHDQFMLRVLMMTGLEGPARDRLEARGQVYLAEVRRIDSEIRIMSLPSYEDGGLERVFRAMLQAPDWDTPALQAFRHFLVGHIKLDSDPDQGHGSLCRHLVPDDRILPLWTAFRNILVDAAPRLVG